MRPAITKEGVGPQAVSARPGGASLRALCENERLCAGAVFTRLQWAGKVCRNCRR